MNLSFLKKEYSFGLNKIHLGTTRFGFYPRYYVALNTRVLAQSRAEISKMPCVKFIGSAGHKYIETNSLTYHINTIGVRSRFSKDIIEGVHEGWTVTHAALQLAYYMGFGQVVIIGMDHLFQQDGAANEAVVRSGPDINHFDPEYFAAGQAWDNPDITESEVSYRAARLAFEKDGREIIDATVAGHCTIFNKSDYRDIFDTSNMP